MEEAQHMQGRTSYVKLTERPTDDFHDPGQVSTCTWHLKREVVLALVFVLTILTSGGLILGFGPVYSKLVAEGQWDDKCANGGGSTKNHDGARSSGQTCPAQEVYLQYVYSTSFLGLRTANLVFGVFLDVAGPRATAVVGMLIAILGNVLMAYGESTVNSGIAIVAGYTMIGAGGYGAYLASYQMIQLFESRAYYCTLLSAMFSTSGYVYMLLMIKGITRRHFYIGYSVLAVCSLVVFFVVYPVRAINNPSSHLPLSGFSYKMAKLVKPQGLWSGLKPELRRKDLWLFAFFFAWGSTLFSFTGGAIPSIFKKAAHGHDTTANLYINYLYPIIVNGSFVWAPAVGTIIDRFGFRVVIFTNIVTLHLFLCSLRLPSLYMQVVTLILMSIAQAVFYALQFSYTMVCFPNRVYGSLQAFLAASSILMCLLNYGFTSWTQNQLNGNNVPVLVILAAPLVPLYFCITDFKRGEQTLVQTDVDWDDLDPV